MEHGLCVSVDYVHTMCRYMEMFTRNRIAQEQRHRNSAFDG